MLIWLGKMQVYLIVQLPTYLLETLWVQGKFEFAHYRYLSGLSFLLYRIILYRWYSKIPWKL